jgi:hypothetical protein
VNDHASSLSYQDVELLDNSNKASTIGILFPGEDVIYGSEAVLKRLLKEYSAVLHGKNAEQVGTFGYRWSRF